MGDLGLWISVLCFLTPIVFMFAGFALYAAAAMAERSEDD